MSGFWYGYIAGLITVLLPSLIFMALIARKAPLWGEEHEDPLFALRRDPAPRSETLRKDDA